MKAFALLLLIVPSILFSQVHQPSGPVTLNPFASGDGYIFMPDAVECTFLKSTDGNYRETTCDYTLPWNAKLNGIQVILKSHAWGDFAYMTIRHQSTGAELSRFGQKFMFDDSKQSQAIIETPYDADLTAGMKIRIHYSTKDILTNVSGIFNFRLHKVVP